MVIKHYFDFGERTNKIMYENGGQIDWELVRKSERNPDFSMEFSRESYIENCKRSISYRKHAEIIADILKQDERCDSNGGVYRCVPLVQVRE